MVVKVLRMYVAILHNIHMTLCMYVIVDLDLVLVELPATCT